MRARLVVVFICKLYRQMYASTGMATDSARRNRANQWARRLAVPCAKPVSGCSNAGIAGSAVKRRDDGRFGCEPVGFGGPLAALRELAARAPDVNFLPACSPPLRRGLTLGSNRSVLRQHRPPGRFTWLQMDCLMRPNSCGPVSGAPFLAEMSKHEQKTRSLFCQRYVFWAATFHIVVDS
jgi:hypothetical protein